MGRCKLDKIRSSKKRLSKKQKLWKTATQICRISAWIPSLSLLPSLSYSVECCMVHPITVFYPNSCRKCLQNDVTCHYLPSFLRPSAWDRCSAGTIGVETSNVDAVQATQEV